MRKGIVVVLRVPDPASCDKAARSDLAVKAALTKIVRGRMTVFGSGAALLAGEAQFVGARAMDSTKSGPIELNFQSVEKVLVVADDGDRFFTTAREAARACKQAENDREFNDQFNAFLKRLHDWSLEHENDISAVYVTVADSGLNVLVCLESDAYRFDLEDALVDLDMELAARFPLCPAEVMQLPKQDSITSDLPSEALLVYDKGRRPQSTGKS